MYEITSCLDRATQSAILSLSWSSGLSPMWTPTPSFLKTFSARNWPRVLLSDSALLNTSCRIMPRVRAWYSRLNKSYRFCFNDDMYIHCIYFVYT